MTDVSPYVRDAAERARTTPSPAQAEPWLRPWLERDLYVIAFRHRAPSNSSFTIGGDSAELLDKAEALASLRQSWADNDTCRVILRPANGEPQDVSEEFARLWMLAMRDDGASRDEVFAIRFIRENIAPRDWEG